MVKNGLLLLILTFAIVGCGGSGGGSSNPPTPTPVPPSIPDRTSVLGAWDVARANCNGFISFSLPAGTNGDTLAFSASGAIGALSGNSNIIFARYTFTEGSPRGELALEIISDNGLADCDGIIGNLTGQSITVFVDFDGNSMNWFAQEQGGTVLENFAFNPAASSDFFGNITSDPNLIIDNVVITPSPVTTGAFVQLMAVVDYTVNDPAGAEIGLGANATFIDLATFPTVRTQIAPGSGTVDLFFDVNTVPDWQPDSDFFGTISMVGNTSGVARETVVIPQTP